MLCPTIVSDFENNLILYFFSAMPQVLGTMLALLGAFYPTRSLSIKTEIGEIYKSVREKIADFNKNGGFNLHARQEVRRLMQLLAPEDKKIAEKFYHLEAHELIFLSYLDSFGKLSLSDYDMESIKENFESIQEQYNKAVFTFDARKGIILENLFGTPLFNSEDLIKTQYLNSLEFRNTLFMIMTGLQKIELYKQMKKSVRKVFIYNGLILGFFIGSFIFLRLTINSVLMHNLFLWAGAFLALSSAYSMIYYVYNSVSEIAQTSLLGLNFMDWGKALTIWIKGRSSKK